MNKKFHITIFDSIYDNKIDKIIQKRNWKQFANFLENLSELVYTKQTAPLISPAVYKTNTRRLNENVEAWGHWAAIDVDSHPFKSKNEIYEYLEKTRPNQAYICYSTASSKKDKPKFRLIFPLNDWLYGSEQIQKFWYSLNKELGDIVDKQTKDVSRMFYIPASYKESENSFFWMRNGDFLIPDELIKKHDADNMFIMSQKSSFLDMIPEKMRESIVQHRKQQLKSEGKYYNWSSWKDCPFVSKKSVNEYREIVWTDAPGRYKGLYQLMLSISALAIKKQYPISSHELKQLIIEIDDDIDGYYRKKGRRIDPEIERAIAWVYSKGTNL